MRSALGSFLALVLTFTGSIVTAQPTKPFPDVPKDHWAYQAVMELKAKGILIGYPDGSFNGAGAKVVKPVYDISTPTSAWHSLLFALRNRDEHGVQHVMTKEFFDSGAFFEDLPTLNHHEPSLKKRLDYYERRGKLWSKWSFQLVTGSTPEEKERILRFTGSANGAVGFLSGEKAHIVAFQKSEDGWRISLIVYQPDKTFQ